MRRRVSVVAGLVACVLAGAAPALLVEPAERDPAQAVLSGSKADAVGTAQSPTTPQRNLHPQHSSDGLPGTIALPRSSAPRSATTTSNIARWGIARGVDYTRWQRTDARGPIRAHLLTIDTTIPGVRLDYANMGKVRQGGPLTSILARTGAIAGVNGDFYDIGRTGAPLGVGKGRKRGLLHARSIGWNNAFYIDRQGRPQIGTLPMKARIVGHPELTITNLNSPFVAPGGIGVYTRQWGATAGYELTQGQRKHIRRVIVRDGQVVRKATRLKAGKPIRGMLLIGRGRGAEQLKALKKGMPVRLKAHLQGRPQMAITGNNFLINDGIIRAVDDRDLHPRTAVGVDHDTGEVLLLVIDGRSSRSRGYTMVELAELMIELGADEAVNLDGGGSTTLVGRGRGGKSKVLNSPSGGVQRWVANGIQVFARGL